MAAKDCLLVTPKVGVGAATQTLHPPDDNGSGEPKDLREGDTSPQSPNPVPLTEGQKRAKSFWGGLVEEGRGPAGQSLPGKGCAKPPPYASQDGAERRAEGRGEDAPGGKREEVLELTSACEREGEENATEKGDWGGQKREKMRSGRRRTNQNVRLDNALIGQTARRSEGGVSQGGGNSPLARGVGGAGARQKDTGSRKWPVSRVPTPDQRPAGTSGSELIQT